MLDVRNVVELERIVTGRCDDQSSGLEHSIDQAVTELNIADPSHGNVDTRVREHSVADEHSPIGDDEMRELPDRERRNRSPGHDTEPDDSDGNGRHGASRAVQSRLCEPNKNPATAVASTNVSAGSTNIFQ